MNWQFWIGDVGIPVVTFIVGLFTGKTMERKSKAKVRGNKNTIIQNSRIEK